MMDSSPVPRISLIVLGLAGLAAGLAVSARAQDDAPGAPPVLSDPATESPTKDDSGKKAQIRVQTVLVTTPVTVVDSTGEFVYGLNEQDFQILDNGVPQRITRFENEVRPVAAVLLIQSDRGVARLLDQVRPLGPVVSALMLGPEGKAAVISYDDRIRVLQDFSGDRDQITQTLRDLKVQGDQARLNDALMRAMAMLERRPRTERRVIVAIADAFDRGSETGDDEVVRRATGSEITIYGLGIKPARALLEKKPPVMGREASDTSVARPTPPGTAPTPSRSEGTHSAPIPIVDILVGAGRIIRSAAASSLLEHYAGYTGGVFFSHATKKALEEQLSRVASEIQSQYEIAYVPDTLDQSGFHRIEVQVRRPDVKARARAGYFYLPPAPQ